jgi:hypothetical protein
MVMQCQAAPSDALPIAPAIKQEAVASIGETPHGMESSPPRRRSALATPGRLLEEQNEEQPGGQNGRARDRKENRRDISAHHGCVRPCAERFMGRQNSPPEGGQTGGRREGCVYKSLARSRDGFCSEPWQFEDRSEMRPPAAAMCDAPSTAALSGTGITGNRLGELGAFGACQIIEAFGRP